MRIVFIFVCVLCVASLILCMSEADAQVDVFVYTQTTQWIGQPAAQAEADILIDMIEGAKGIGNVVNDPANALAEWTEKHTVKKGQHLIVLFGDIPPEIYPVGNAKPEGSIAEEFLDAGNTFSNSADYFFWGLGNRNAEGGLQNMMDIPGILQWDDDTPMKVTPEGEKLTPTLKDYACDRPFHIDQIANGWELEIAFATNTGKADGATRCDPCIIRHTETGARLIQVYQTANQDDPKGEVIAEIILNYYLETVGAQAVEPEEKLPVLWGNIKTRR
ncbi:MAG: hypothetical protein OXD54_18315 [Candidatus Poribacteria bacterium]|nr:hypothetical protein [Candidatus Poribacteria bacterium]